MLGTKLDFDDFLQELEDENIEDKSIELVDLNTNEVKEISQSDFKKYIKGENIKEFD